MSKSQDRDGELSVEILICLNVEEQREERR